MADAYVYDLTAHTLTKNGVAVPFLTCDLLFHATNEPGALEVPGVTNVGFRIVARIVDTAADARILAQGPPGLLGGSVAAFAGKPAEYKMRSKAGDTILLLNSPGTPVASGALEAASVDGYQPS